MKPMSSEKRTKMTLSPEAKAARAAYQKRWAQRNPEKVRQYMANYWERKGQQNQESAGVTDNVTDNVTVPVSVTQCKYCRKEFNPRRSTAKFCSPACRVNYNRSTKIKNI